MTDKDKPHGNIVHGANSATVRQRFDDLRTSEGKALSEAIGALTSHFGGPKEITAPMQVLLDAAIRPKLIVLTIIADWVNRQVKLVKSDGALPPVLGSHYLAYTNGLRRDLESLCNMAKDAGNKVKPPSIAELIK